MVDTPAVTAPHKADGCTIDWNHSAACQATIIDPENCVIDWKGRTKLAIVGFASSTRELAPYDNPEWVIWGLNQLYRHIKRADAWVDIHYNYNEPAAVVEGTDFDKWLAAAPIPVFMCNRQPAVPNSVKYPLQPIIDKFGARYFTSTISYMIAYGIWAGFREIGIWGVDLIVGKEYFYQKSCAEFWIGVANGLGIEVRIPDDSALLKGGFLYGFEPEPKSLVNISEFQRRIGECEKRKAELLRELQTVDGAKQDAAFWLELAELRARGGSIPVVG